LFGGDERERWSYGLLYYIPLIYTRGVYFLVDVTETQGGGIQKRVYSNVVYHQMYANKIVLLPPDVRVMRDHRLQSFGKYARCVLDHPLDR
jgi:hypothetical protein